MYTTAKSNLAEAYGGVENLPKDFSSIRPNFIEQLKKGLDMDQVEEVPEEIITTTQVIEYQKRGTLNRLF